jgi:hypothetical protein
MGPTSSRGGTLNIWHDLAHRSKVAHALRA